MPLSGYKSLCNERAVTIVSRDKGGRQSHVATNRSGESFVSHYKIDGEVITGGNRCDFLLFNESKHTAYLIELKGSDMVHACVQLEATEKALAHQLSEYSVFYRIVTNRCGTHELEDSQFKKYKMKWKQRLAYKSLTFPENI